MTHSFPRRRSSDLAQEAVERGESLPELLGFEEKAGLVPVSLLLEGETIAGAELIAPEPLSRHAQVTPERVAACICLSADDIRTDRHLPQVVSVGLPFLVVELASREALPRARPDRVT